MTGRGHTLVALAFAMTTYKVSLSLGINPVLSSLATIVGGTAPDWLELRKRTGGTLIRHRTITHWLIPWLCLFFLSFGIIQEYDILKPIEQKIPNEIVVFLFGFSIGGLLHLLFDLPNPMGIPILTPYNRMSLNLWKSGKFEIPIIISVLIVSLYCIGVIDITALNLYK